MTATVNSVGDSPAEVPEYPMARASDCPFDPPPALRDKQREGPLARVRLWDGSTPWLVTRGETRYGTEVTLTSLGPTLRWSPVQVPGTREPAPAASPGGAPSPATPPDQGEPPF